jgi:large subunit ribosomal protein L15
MKELSRLTPPEGATKKKKRLGRGPGSGLGKTAGRGHKGQGARTSKNIPPYFEGGQMPLYRRLPKRGFKNIFGKTVAWVNVDQLNRFEEGTIVDAKLLKASGLVKGRFDAIKCLGGGDLEKKLTVQLDMFSKSAIEKIEAKGGKAEVTSG